jgi:hypothetical protein
VEWAFNGGGVDGHARVRPHLGWAAGDGGVDEASEAGLGVGVGHERMWAE